MKHHKAARKLGRKTDVRRALLRSLAYNLVKNKKIKTTEAKAKEVRPFVERLITKAKSDNLASVRLVAAELGEQAAKKLVKDIAPNYKDRNGGYTRIIKLPARKGDASKMAIIELV